MSSRTSAVWRTAPAIAAVLLLWCAPRVPAQQTGYGEDPTPGSNLLYERWPGYGTDPVPHSRLDDSGYLRAYGFDLVPGTPKDIYQSAPAQPLEALSGSVEAGAASRRGNR
jgi:hypothetical protein